MNALQNLLDSNGRIYIVSEDGSNKNLYRGKRNLTSIANAAKKIVDAKVFIDCGPIGNMRENWYDMTKDIK